MNRDLSSRIANAFGDYADLIVRKAGEKQRNDGLANAASQHRCSHPSDRAPTGNDPGRNQEHRGGGTANNLPPSNSND
jgi:hypothetical protein